VAERPQLRARTRAPAPFENDTPYRDNVRTRARRHAMSSRWRAGAGRQGRGACAQRNSGQRGDICLGEHPGVSRSGLHGRTMMAPMRRVNQPEVAGGKMLWSWYGSIRELSSVAWAKLPGTSIINGADAAQFCPRVLRRGPTAWATRRSAVPRYFNAAVRARCPPYMRPLTIRRA